MREAKLVQMYIFRERSDAPYNSTHPEPELQCKCRIYNVYEYPKKWICPCFLQEYFAVGRLMTIALKLANKHCINKVYVFTAYFSSWHVP